MGWEDNGQFLERLLRSHVIKYSSYFELDDAVGKARNLFDDYLNETKKLAFVIFTFFFKQNFNYHIFYYFSPQKHIVEAVYCTGIKYGSYKMWIKLFNRSIDANAAEQSIIWQALVCNRDTWILKGYFKIIFLIE